MRRLHLQRPLTPAAVTVSRIWHGRTTRAAADAYGALLRTEIFHAIAARGITGYRRRRSLTSCREER
ncbi:MAG TPA: hypothetical protein VNA89_13555 [Gemmatimonadaceae bacterium]|nr:hypothetical protein [Gemmatimonadaceae bacterium]